MYIRPLLAAKISPRVQIKNPEMSARNNKVSYERFFKLPIVIPRLELFFSFHFKYNGCEIKECPEK